MRKILAALALFAAPALAAIETTTITGTVYSPSGGAYPGKVTCTLSHAGTASDGVNQQVVASYYTATIGSDGALSFTLVPNDVITPAGTWYSCEYTVQPVGGRRMTWVKTYSVATSPDPVALGAVSILDNPTLTLPTITGTANSMMATDGSGGLVSTPALQRAASGNAIKIVSRFQINCGYADLDGDLDGTVEDRTMWDYDCDGTKEGSDWNSGIDGMCDSNSDNIQDGPSIDLDGDGTAGTHEKRCGSFHVTAGTYVLPNATDRINIKWKGLVVEGAGIDATLVKPTFSRAAYCATLPVVRTAIIQTVDLDGVPVGATAGSSKGVDWFTIGGMTIDNIGERSTTAAGSITGGPFDCNSDGTADAGSSGEGLNNLNLKGLPGDTNADSIYDTWDSVEHVHVHDMKFLNCDGACVFLDEVNDSLAEHLWARNSSEHCYAGHGNDENWDNIVGLDCGNRNWGAGGRGIEIFIGNVDTKRFSLTNFWLDGVIGIGIISADNSGNPVSAPKKSGDGILIAHGHVSANDYRDSGATDNGYCLQSNTPATMAGRVKNVVISDVLVDRCSNWGLVTSQYDQDWVVDNVRFKNTSYDTGATANPVVQLVGTNMKLSNSDIALTDYAGDGNYDTQGGVDLNTCTRCELSGNNIHGNGRTGIPLLGINVTPTSNEPRISDNVIDLDRDSTTTDYAIGIRVKGSDDGEYSNNLVRLPATTNKYGFYLGEAGNVATRNRYDGNRILGGGTGFYEEAGAVTDYTVGTSNYASPSVSGGAGFQLQNSKDTSVWAYNICQSFNSNACFYFSGSTATTRHIGNISLQPKSSTIGTTNLTDSINAVELDANTIGSDNTVDTGVWVGGTGLQARAVCMSGANATDGFDACFSPTNPTGTRTITTPDATGYLAVSTRNISNGNQMIWSVKETICSTVCNNTFGPGSGCSNTVPDNSTPKGNCTDVSGVAYHWCLCQ